MYRRYSIGGEKKVRQHRKRFNVREIARISVTRNPFWRREKSKSMYIYTRHHPRRFSMFFVLQGEAPRPARPPKTTETARTHLTEREQKNVSRGTNQTISRVKRMFGRQNKHLKITKVNFHPLQSENGKKREMLRFKRS